MDVIAAPGLDDLLFDEMWKIVTEDEKKFRIVKIEDDEPREPSGDEAEALKTLFNEPMMGLSKCCEAGLIGAPRDSGGFGTGGVGITVERNHRPAEREIKLGSE